MNTTALVITSIAGDHHPILKGYAVEAQQHGITFILVGDTKSPEHFRLQGCDYYSVERQKTLELALAKMLPYKHYSRKNLGYLVAMRQGAEVILETDDDNIPLPGFWAHRHKQQYARRFSRAGWVNVYKLFSDAHLWPRGFALEEILRPLPEPVDLATIYCPIQQGLADDNPDVDALYRLTLPLPITFAQGHSVALAEGSICPFNSQNTTWFKEAFPLLYLPSYCSFRMTDIWRSFIAQRIAWSCGWSILFSSSTVRQERNDHNLMSDFCDEIPGYTKNYEIMRSLSELSLKEGVEHLGDNLRRCYLQLVDCQAVAAAELDLVDAWLKDVGTPAT